MENDNRYFDLDSVNMQAQKQEITKDEKGGAFWGGVVVGLAAALVIVGIVFVGTRLGQGDKSDDKPKVAQTPENSAIDASTVAKLQVLEDTIDEYFYLEEITDEELQEGIYKGMLEALDDPYSEYYTKQELQDLVDQMSGIYYGIGAYVSLDEATSLPKISGVIAGTPAETAGLRENDLIYQVDDMATYGLTLTEAVSYIRGEEGTEVTLTIMRDGEKDYLEFTAIRQKVESPTVEYEMFDNQMGYIQIISFEDVTADQFADALATLKGSGMESLVLDLRGNPGGSLTAVVDVANMLLPEGLIVYTEDKNGKCSEYFCDGKRELDIPMVVLVDMNSASAAEILAGAIQDYGKGTLVGTTTFGKGIVQQIIPFKDDTAVKITVSSYFTPKGRDIHEIGIEPDILCEFDGEAYYGSEERPDNQLEKAKEVLNEMVK